MPSISSVTNIWPSQFTDEPIPIVGIFNWFVITFADVEMDITGFDLTASLGSINLINWAEVDVGTSVVWTEVDRAA